MDAEHAVDLPHLDVFSEAYAADPYPLITRARAAGPVARSDRGLEFLRHPTCQRVLMDRRLNTGFAGVLAEQGITGGPMFDLFVSSLIGAEGDLHRRLRGAIMPYFNAGAVQRLRAASRRHVDDWLAEAQEAGTCDFAEIVGRRLPSALFCRMIGAPLRDAPFVAGVSDRILRILTFLPGTGAAAEEALAEAHDWFAELIEERRRDPGEDLLSAMLAASGDDALTDAEVMDLALTVLGGSTDNTNTQMCLNLLALHENPDAWAALRSDRSLVPSAVVEGARWKPGFLAGFRIAEEEIEVEGVAVEPGAMIYTNVLAANRDPAVYDDPDRFDLSRTAPAGLNFGHGRHFCAGRPVAVVEMEEALRAALDRWSDFSVGDREIVGSPFSLRVDRLALTSPPPPGRMPGR